VESNVETLKRLDSRVLAQCSQNYCYSLCTFSSSLARSFQPVAELRQQFSYEAAVLFAPEPAAAKGFLAKKAGVGGSASALPAPAAQRAQAQRQQAGHGQGPLLLALGALLLAAGAVLGLSALAQWAAAYRPDAQWALGAAAGGGGAAEGGGGAAEGTAGATGAGEGVGLPLLRRRLLLLPARCGRVLCRGRDAPSAALARRLLLLFAAAGLLQVGV
jgi:hypothetical protein